MIKYDSFHLIGDKHDICQDYIIHGEVKLKDEVIPYVILSDGCSSSPNTDIGSRLLVLSAEKVLHDFDFDELNDKQQDIHSLFYNILGKVAIFNSNDILSHLPTLSNMCLDATLMVMFKFQDHIFIAQYGDGSIIQINNKIIDIRKIEFENNTPYYLNVQYNKILREQYFNEVGTTLSVYWNTWEDNIIKYECNIIKDLTSMSIFKVNIHDVDKVYIASDGIDSFINTRDQTSKSSYEIIKNLAGAKNTNGNFIKRIMKNKNGIINKLRKDNIVNTDDVSIGCFVNVKD